MIKRRKKMKRIEYGLLHCHTENSLKDSALSPKDLVKKAVEYGSPAVSLTDHGVMSGTFEFISACKKENIKGIVGVEAYVQQDDDLSRKHLILLAKNYDGYLAISKAVTMSNSRIDKVPRMNKEIILKCFGEGSKGFNNVIATSACVGGILSTILLSNTAVGAEIEKLKTKQKKYTSPNDEAFIQNQKKLDDENDKIASLIEKRDALQIIANKKYVMREKGLAKLSGEEYDDMRIKLEQEKKETEKAKIELEAIKKELSATKRNATLLRGKCKEAKADHDKWLTFENKINQHKAKIVSDETLLDMTKKEALWYQNIFGDDFYIELQYHGIPDEEFVMPKLADISQELNIPVVCSNDIHYANNSADDVRARAIVQALRFNKWLPSRPDDTEYYVKDDNELRDWLSRILDKSIIDKCFEGIKDIVDKCNIEFPSETHFPRFISEGETSSERLRRLTEEGIKKRYKGEFKYRDRVEYELEIIEKMNYTDYLCIVQDYIEYGRKVGKDNPEGVGYTIGPGRGSAAGSLVCYLIGITNIDPMPLGLIFERFLNPDRVSFPDIDVDFARCIRESVINYVKTLYGENAICGIATKGTLAAKNAIRSVARVYGDELYGDTMRFYDLGDAMTKVIPNTPNITFENCEKEIVDAFGTNKDAMKILHDAKLVEGVAINYGTHAAGIIIADNRDVSDYIPLMFNEENEMWATQYNMVECEKNAGLLKFDFLGLKNLDIITDTIRAIKRNTGITIDMDNIPQEAVVYKEIFQKGKTNFIFQFESNGMKNLLRRFKPENLENLTLLNAMYRPGPLQFIDDVCNVKNGKQKPTYICEAAKEVLGVTYSYPIYQEQIMSLCNKVAGFSMAEADNIRRFMSKKKAEEMAKYKPLFIDGLVNSGAERKSAEDFWEKLMDFASYCFNKSHAAAYAFLAYQTAYLKYHYPTEYMASVMNHTPIDKLPMMIQECKDLGVKISVPNVNYSNNNFTGKGSVILFGLSNIKNVGNGAVEIIAERKKGAFTSFKDFLRRTTPRKDVCEALIDAGAMDMWCKNRTAMKTALPNLLADIKKINEKKVIIDTETDEKKVTKAKKAMEEYLNRFNHTVLPVSIHEDVSEKLNKENELLGMYISGHPLDEYILDSRAVDIESINENGYYTVCGSVKNIRYTHKKADGQKMAFFKLEDKSGIIDVAMFTKAFKKYGDMLKEGVFAIEGDVSIEEDGDTVKKQIFLSSLRPVERRQHKILIEAPIIEWNNIRNQILPFVSESGLPVVLFETILGEFRESTIKVSSDILECQFDNFTVSELCQK